MKIECSPEGVEAELRAEVVLRLLFMHAEGSCSCGLFLDTDTTVTAGSLVELDLLDVLTPLILVDRLATVCSWSMNTWRGVNGS